MTPDSIVGFVVIPLAIVAVVGVIHNTVRVTQLETKMEALWKWWLENHTNGDPG